MNRNELISALAERARLGLPEARRAIRSLFSVAEGEGLIADALDHGERVVLTGFGTFVPCRRQGRVYRDPRTGRRERSPAARTVRFRPGVGLKERLR